MGYMLEKYGTLEKTRNYEMVYLIIPTLTERESNNVSDDIISAIKEIGGKVFHKESWHLKKLAYPIKKFTSAYYYLINFECLPSKIDEINNILFANENVLRHLIVKMDRYHLEFRKSRGRKDTSKYKKEKAERSKNIGKASLKKEAETPSDTEQTKYIEEKTEDIQKNSSSE